MKTLSSELKISANTSIGIRYIIEYWFADCEGVTDFMQQCSTKLVSYSFSARENFGSLLQFSSSTIFPNKVLKASFTLDLFEFIFVTSGFKAYNNSRGFTNSLSLLMTHFR